MRIHEAWTQLPPAAVIERARRYFGSQHSPKSAFVEEAGENHLRLHLDMGEIVIAVLPSGDGYLVRGSASRGEGALSRFLATFVADARNLPTREAPAQQPAKAA